MVQDSKTRQQWHKNKHTMTQAQFNMEFKRIVSNWEVMTLTDRRLHYNELVEQYGENGLITERQRQNWGHPKFLLSNKGKINCSAY